MTKTKTKQKAKQLPITFEWSEDSYNEELISVKVTLLATVRVKEPFDEESLERLAQAVKDALESMEEHEGEAILQIKGTIE